MLGFPCSLTSESNRSEAQVKLNGNHGCRARAHRGALLAKLAVVIVLVGFTSASFASVVSLDEATQGKGNKGLEFRPLDGMGPSAVYLLTARSSINEAEPLVADATGSPGTIVISKNGAGVQGSEADGSKGISGGGGHQDEELIFSYFNPVEFSSIVLGLNDIDFGHGWDDKDDVVLFVSLAGSGVFGTTILEDEVALAFTPSGEKKHGSLHFADMTSLAAGTLIDSFKIRAAEGHFYVDAVAQIPEPATLALVAMGGLSLIARRRKD